MFNDRLNTFHPEEKYHHLIEIYCTRTCKMWGFVYFFYIQTITYSAWISMFPNSPIFKSNGLLSLCLHFVTNDVQCNTYLFDPFRHIRIVCALVGTEKCTIYCLSQDPFLKTWNRQICTYFWFCFFMNKQSPRFEL